MRFLEQQRLVKKITQHTISIFINRPLIYDNCEMECRCYGYDGIEIIYNNCNNVAIISNIYQTDMKNLRIFLSNYNICVSSNHKK